MSTRVVQMLRDRNVNLRDLRDSEGRSALFFACMREESRTVAAMLLREVGIDPNALDKGGRTAAHACAMFDRREVLMLLINAGADIDRGDEAGRTPLHNACARGHDECALLLIAAGADIMAADSGSQSVCHFAVTSTPLVLRAVLAAGADLDTPDNDGCTPRSLFLMYDVTPPSDEEIGAARRRIDATRLDLVRARALQVCVGLQSRGLDALTTCEILQHACGRFATLIPFHQWWKIATAVKHFQR